MSEVEVLPEVKEIVGAMLFASKQPLTVDQMRNVFKQVAEKSTGAMKDYGKVTRKQLQEAVDTLSRDLGKYKLGFTLNEVAGGYRFENAKGGGPWLRQLLEKSKGPKLSRPALETLAVIAYRQPCTRSEIEAVRGVAVDQIVRNLLELQLVRLLGRSDLPGRPWLFGTTQKFLEHFGLRNLDDLPSREELKRFEEEAEKDPSDDQAALDFSETEEAEPVADDPASPKATQDKAGVDDVNEEQDDPASSEASGDAEEAMPDMMPDKTQDKVDVDEEEFDDPASHEASQDK